MSTGKQVVQLWSINGPRSYQIHLAAPQTREHAIEHLRHVEPHVRRNLVIRELEVLSETSAEDALREERAERPTDPCPAPGEEAAE